MSEQTPMMIAPVGRHTGNTGRPGISATVWRKGWRRKASATQASSAAISGVIRWFNAEDFTDVADEIRRSAMQLGVRKAEAQLNRQIAVWLKSRKKHRYPHD